MIFQKSSPRNVYERAPASEPVQHIENDQAIQDEVETVVGPSVNVEGDFASQGNIVVKGSVAGSVYTSKNLTVEPGAKIMANVRAGSCRIAGEVKGNMKIKESLELTSTAKVLGDIEVRVLTVEPGAILYGKVTMPGVDVSEKNSKSRVNARKEDPVSDNAV